MYSIYEEKKQIVKWKKRKRRNGDKNKIKNTHNTRTCEHRIQ